jgi:peptidoglycan/LPS O-acetylase OafA/YrhL
VLASRPLLWLGTVSYGLYLWQFLILDSVLPAPPSFVHPYAWYVLRGLAVTAIVAGLSYRLAPDASDGC